MPRRRESPDTPRVDTDDELTLREERRASQERRDPDSPSARVRAAINQMSASGPDAEFDYRMTLRALAGDARAAAAAVADMYRATPEDHYMN